MKHTITVALAALALAATASGEVSNRISVSGKTTVAGPEATRNGVTTSRLEAAGITNSALLDIMVAEGSLGDKRGYSIVELSDDDGNFGGYYAWNSRSGDMVEVDPFLVSGRINAREVTAGSSGTRNGWNGGQEIYTTQSTGTATASLFGTEAHVFYTGTSARRYSNRRVSGQIQSSPYMATTYTATVRGVSSDDEMIDARIVSSASAYASTED